MRVDIYTKHLNHHFGIAKRQLKALADKWCKANWGAGADEFCYRGPEGLIAPAHFERDCINGEGALSASVVKPGLTESVVFVLHQSPTV